MTKALCRVALAVAVVLLTYAIWGGLGLAIGLNVTWDNVVTCGLIGTALLFLVLLWTKL